MKDRIIQTKKINWRDVQNLQPDDVKRSDNLEHIKSSLRTYGFAKAYDIWKDPEGNLFWLDGHTRTQALTEMEKDGEAIPKTLTANFIDCKDRSEAIKILIEVHNQKQNPFFENTLTAWLEVEDIEIEDIKIETINYTDKRYVKDFEYERSQVVLENQYDDSEAEMNGDADFEDVGQSLEQKGLTPPKEPDISLLPFYANISKKDNSLFEKYRKAQKMNVTNFLSELVTFYNENAEL